MFYAKYTVTPCVGVWIETVMEKIKTGDNLSHPAWVCGLKLPLRITEEIEIKSHPAWVCGLKLLIFYTCFNDKPVTPCVGVWIETQGLGKDFPTTGGHTLRGCVD